jgi:hypothetical protein
MKDLLGYVFKLLMALPLLKIPGGQYSPKREILVLQDQQDPLVQLDQLVRRDQLDRLVLLVQLVLVCQQEATLDKF